MLCLPWVLRLGTWTNTVRRSRACCQRWKRRCVGWLRPTGQPLADPDAVVDYERDLTTWSVASGRRLTHHSNEHLCLWDLGN